MTLSEEWLTLNQAAKQLGLSPRTVRRWIHDGKLNAELRPGPYGQQYLVPTKQVAAVRVTRDLERAERQADLGAIAAILEGYLAQRENRVADAVEALRTELQESIARLEERQSALQQELAALRGTLSAVLPQTRPSVSDRKATGRGE